MFVCIFALTHGHALIITTRKNTHRVWKFQSGIGFTDMLPLFLSPACACEKLQLEHRLGRQTPFTVSFNALLLCSGTYLSALADSRLSVFQGVLKTCLEDMTIKALKKSRDCNGAPRSQILQSPGSVICSISFTTPF